MGRAQTLNLLTSRQSNQGFGLVCEFSSVQSRRHCRGLQMYRNTIMSGTKMPHFSQHYWENEPRKAPPRVFLLLLAYACCDTWNNPLNFLQEALRPGVVQCYAPLPWNAAAPTPPAQPRIFFFPADRCIKCFSQYGDGTSLCNQSVTVVCDVFLSENIWGEAGCCISQQGCLFINAASPLAPGSQTNGDSMKNK